MWRHLIHVLTGRPVVLVVDLADSLHPRLVRRRGWRRYVKFSGEILLIRDPGEFDGRRVARGWMEFLGSWRDA